MTTKILTAIIAFGFITTNNIVFAQTIETVKKNEIAKSQDKSSEVLKNYISTIGGKEKLQKISSLTMRGKTQMNGYDFDLVRIYSNKGEEKVDIYNNGISVYKSAFDGKTGYTESQGQKIDMTSEQIENKLKNKEVFPELKFLVSNELQFLGKETFNNEECYALKTENTTYYYSAKTFLRTGKTTVKNGKTSTTIYSDYRNVEGIMYPFKQIIDDGKSTIEIQSVTFNKATEADFK